MGNILTKRALTSPSEGYVDYSKKCMVLEWGVHSRFFRKFDSHKKMAVSLFLYRYNHPSYESE
jgi:hypothetical protein